MNSTIQRLPVTAAKQLKHLFREMVPVVSFFFAGLIIILLILKLFVAQYSIEFYAFSRAAIGALILGKAVLLMEWADSTHGVSRFPRAAVIAFKTLMYGLAVLILGLAEQLIHRVREAGSFRGGVELMIANANLDRFLGLVLLISLLVATYLVMEEISRAMGKGALFKLFFRVHAGE